MNIVSTNLGVEVKAKSIVSVAEQVPFIAWNVNVCVGKLNDWPVYLWTNC